MEFKVVGKIISISEVQKGVSKENKEWSKLNFVIDNNEQYNSIYSFDVFGNEKVENFIKYNKLNAIVEVYFNIQCKEYQGKYFTNLQSWRINPVQQAQQNTETPETVLEEGEDDLPF